MTRNTLWIATVAAFAAGAVHADETTIIREHRGVQTPPPAAQPAPQPMTTTVRHTRSTRATTTSTDGASRPRHIARRHRVFHHHAAAVAQQRMAPPQTPAAATFDRKTVIHRDEDGDVTRHTMIEKQGADASQTTIEHRSTTTPDDAPPHS